MLYSGSQCRTEHSFLTEMHPPADWTLWQDHEQISPHGTWEKQCLFPVCAWLFPQHLYMIRKTVVLSILGTYFNGMVLDHFIFDHNIKRRVCVITQKEEELRKFIIEDLHSGATIYEATGAYNMKKRNEIITIVDKTEYQKLMAYINNEDPKAFVTVYNVSDMRYQPKL